MAIELKKIRDQVIVVTGASSGIGRATARLAAKRGASVVLAARDEESLAEATDEITQQGGRASYAVADVADPYQVQALAEEAHRAFGGFDTWVNNAGVAIYGRLEEVSLEDARRLFDVNYWGVVHGSLTAVRHLRERGAGAIINVGTATSKHTLALQGHFNASKKAVGGFTESLRAELELDDAPISVTLLEPSNVATQHADHAKSYLKERPTLPPPLYAPEVVARAVIACAQKPVRALVIGAVSRRPASGSPGRPGSPRPDGQSNLYRPMPGGRERGEFDRHIRKSSLRTGARLRPGRAILGAAAIGVGLVWAATRMRRVAWVGR